MDYFTKDQIENITMNLSEIPGYWDNEQQKFTDVGLAKLNARLQKPEYVEYALSLFSYDAE